MSPYVSLQQLACGNNVPKIIELESTQWLFLSLIALSGPYLLSKNFIIIFFYH